MGSTVETYLGRARSELGSAAVLFESSCNEDFLGEIGLDTTSTFYSGVIAHAYYAIFYTAKAMLLSKNIATYSPEVHRKTLEEFKKMFIDSGLLDVKLLMIYREMIIRADTLLEIYREEKRKRGNFTYNTIPQANAGPANESIAHAKLFFKHCSTYLDEYRTW